MRRQIIEKRIANKLFSVILSKGYLISIHDGEEYVLKGSDNLVKCLKAIMSTDEDIISVSNKEGKKLAFIYLVYGNDGYDVISDYSANELCEDIMSEVNAYIDNM